MKKFIGLVVLLTISLSTFAQKEISHYWEISVIKPISNVL